MLMSQNIGRILPVKSVKCWWKKPDRTITKSTPQPLSGRQHRSEVQWPWTDRFKALCNKVFYSHIQDYPKSYMERQHSRMTKTSQKEDQMVGLTLIHFWSSNTGLKCNQDIYLWSERHTNGIEENPAREPHEYLQLSFQSTWDLVLI